jgi:hypothetical protein
MMVAAVAVTASAAGKATRVVGKVVDGTGAPVRTAQLRIRGSRSSAMVVVALNGTFESVLESEEKSVTVDITAPGFEKRNRTLVVTDGTADAGTVSMVPSKGLSLSGFTVSRSGDGSRNHLDVFVQNDSSRPMAVLSVRVRGMRRNDTECLDATPGLQFSITDQLWDGKVAAAIKAAEATDSVAATGEFHQLGCGQQRIDMTMPYSFSLDPGERTKVRIAIPSALRASRRETPVAVRLEKFVVVTMTLHASEGNDVTVSRQIAYTP